MWPIPKSLDHFYKKSSATASERNGQLRRFVYEKKERLGPMKWSRIRREDRG